MLNKLWMALLDRWDPKPWDKPRLVWGNEPEYAVLRSRLDVVDTPLESLSAIPALDLLRDRHTGQRWITVIVDDSPMPLCGLQPHDTP
ncbi:MAG: hypothetical protein RLZZ618_804 [Pseudomonadota bacterium]|jgi:hypothetical protein